MTRERLPLWTRWYGSTLGGTFFGYVGFQMLVPTLTAHIHQLGGTNLSAGLAYSVAAAAALIARAVFGSKMDIVGRTPILLIGTAIVLVTNLSLFAVSDISFIIVIRIFQGVGWGMLSTALATIISDIVPKARIGEGIGYFALSIVLATSLSIILGIVLMNNYGFVSTLLFSTVSFAATLVLCRTTSAIPFVRNHPTDTGGRQILSRLFEKSALFPAFICFLHSIAFSGIMAYIMLFGAERGINNVWIYFIGHLFMIIVSRPLVGRLFDRRGHAVVIMPGIVFMIAGLIFLSYSQSVSLLVVASLCYGLGFGTVQPSLQAWAIHRSPKDRKGAANGTFLSSIDLGYAVGTVLMGAIASATSYAFMYRASSSLLVACLIIYGIFLMREKTPSHMAAQ